MTNLRLRGTIRDGGVTIPLDGGAWFVSLDKGITDYHRKLLAEYRADEPANNWRLETRGTGTLWSKVAD